MEFNSFGPAVGRLGSDSSRGAQVEAGGPIVEAGGAEPPLAPSHFNHWFEVDMTIHCRVIAFLSANISRDLDL